MAFKITQTFNFESVEYSYDRERDVLYISFGPPAPSIAVQIEDWLALRLSLQPPLLSGMTIVGFRRIFRKINRYIEQELPERIDRLSKASIVMSYDDQTDTLILRLDEEAAGLRDKPSFFEPLAENVYIEKTLPEKNVIGVKILEYTRCGEAAVEAFLGTIVDTLFEPQRAVDENARLVTEAVIQRLDLPKLSALAA